MKVTLFPKPEQVLIEPETCGFDEDGSNNASNLDLRFKTYESPLYMHNVDLSANGGLEFLQLPHIRLDHASSSSNVRVLEVGMEYPSKDAFLATLKCYNFKNGVNYHVAKSRSEKFKRKYAIRNTQ